MSTPTTPRPRHRARHRASWSARTARRGLHAALFGLLPVALAASVLAGAPTTATAPAVDEPSGLAPVAAALPSAPLNTFTLNVLHDLPADLARADMDRAMTLGDIGGFQEMSDEEDRQTLIALCAAKDYGYYMPPEGGLAIPIVWNRARFRLIDGHTTKTHGPVPGSPSRFVNVVRLRELATGKVFGIINTHVISNASFDAQLSDMSKIPLLRAHLQILRSEILALFNQTENVFVSGDLNVNYLADKRRQNPGLPTSALGDIVNFDMPNTGSVGPGSLLDYGMTMKHNGGLALTSSNIAYDFNSDHDAVQFHYNPVDVFADGPVFSDREGDSYAQRAVVDREMRAIQDTEAGSTIRIVTSKLDDQSITDQLAAAHARGVNVQLVLGPGPVTGQEQALANILGADTAQPSFAKKCSGGCLSGSSATQSTFLLFDRTGSATNLTMAPSSSLQAKNVASYGDVFVSTDDALYAGYAQVFAQFLTDTPLATRKLSAGSHQILLYPTAKDPVASALARVKCDRARGLTVTDKRTNVRVQVASWSGARGKKLAERLGTLKRQGCNVQVLSGKKVNNKIKSLLKQAKVKRKAAKVSQNLLIVDGRYAKKNKVSTAWVGGPYWTDKALKSDGTSLTVSDKTAVGSYLADFASIWKAS